jgi:hypothetical protein
VRRCAIERGIDTCGHCQDFVCGNLKQRIVSLAEIQKRLEKSLTAEEYHLFVDKLSEILSLPDTIRPSELLVYGYPNQRMKARDKKPLSELILANEYG